MDNLTKRVAIVILNWNGMNFLEKFIPFLIQFSENCDIFIGDNFSTDNSILFIEKNYPQIKIVKLSENFGFCKGYNLTLDQVNAEYYILLNSDVKVSSNWVQPLIDTLNSDDKIAICQPKIKMYDQKTHFEYAGAAGGMIDYLGYPFCRGRIFETVEEDCGQYEKEQSIFWASGACFAIKSSVFHELGGFDNSFFAHMEEIDLCWRAQNIGYEVFYQPKSVVYHVGGGTLNKNSPFKTFLNFRNGLYLLHKNLPKSILFSTILKRLMLDGIAGMQLLLRGDFKHIFAILKAHFYYYSQISVLNKDRNNNEIKNLPILVFNKSILVEYFINKKKKFTDL